MIFVPIQQVTGAESYIGGAVIERLLAAGHTVHGTWRGRDEQTIRHLFGMKNAATNLKLFIVSRRCKKGCQDIASPSHGSRREETMN